MTRKQLQLVIAEAQAAGSRAFENGENRAPALSKDFTKLTNGCNINERCKIAIAFLKGWDLANLYG